MAKTSSLRGAGKPDFQNFTGRETNGKVEAGSGDSAAASGSVATTEAAGAEPITQFDQITDLQTGTILVLDDDPLSLDIVARVAASAFPGVQVRAEIDVAEALALCETRPIDCLLIDYDMPLVDGLTTARYLRARHPEIAIVLFTGVGDRVLAIEALRAGVNGYLTKQRISAPSLRQAVNTAIALVRLGPQIGDPDDPPPDLGDHRPRWN